MPNASKQDRIAAVINARNLANADALRRSVAECVVCRRVFPNMNALNQHQMAAHLPSAAEFPMRTRRRRARRTGRRSGALVSLPPGNLPLYPGNAAALSNVGRGLGLSVAGEEWCVRAISPCDERFEEGRQIPDLATAESAVITSRQITAITGPGGTGQLWNLLVVTIPVPEIAFIYKKWQPSDVSDPTTLPWTVVRYRAVQQGVLNITGRSASSTQYSYKITDGTLLTQAEQFRQSAKGLTLNLNASALNNQGMVMIAQYGEKMTYVSDFAYDFEDVVAPEQLNVGGETSTGVTSPLNMGPVYVIDEVPTTTDQIFQKDPHAVRQNARLGAYLPLKFNDPVSPFQPVALAELRADGESSASATPISALVPLVVQSTTTTSTISKQWLQSPDHGPPAGTRASICGTAGLTNMQVGTVFFEGISLSASVDVKAVAALEVVATGDSTWAGFMRSSPEEDDVVQKQVHAVQRRLPSGHPSSYNFLGTLLTKVAPMLGGLAVDLVTSLYHKFVNGANRASSVG